MDVKEYLQQKSAAYEVLPHPHTVGAFNLAESVRVPCENVAKTVLLHMDHGYGDAVAVVPANARVKLEEASKMLGGAQITMGSHEDVATRCPDCEHGVLPPFGSQYGMRTLVDKSLAGTESIVFEGNTHEEAIRLSWHDFERIENPLVGEIALLE
jgi:Ala-tRNA(Pro) deacylase